MGSPRCPARRPVLALAFLFACGGSAGAPATRGRPTAGAPRPSPSAPPIPPEPAPPARVAPVPLPPIPPEAPAPTAPLPAGTPTVEGEIDTVVAIDAERAIVRFFVPGLDHARRWWLAAMHRDGRVDWVRELGGQSSDLEGASTVQLVGDAVSILTWEATGGDPPVTLQAFALADGTPRFTLRLGEGFPDAAFSDGTLRFDTRTRSGRTSSGRSTSELVATSATGLAWRAPIGPPPPPGHDPTLVGDVLAVRTSEDFGEHATWMVFERASGRRVGQVRSFPQSCSDGRRWLVRTEEGLVEVDPRTLTTRVFFRDPELPSAGRWSVVDCSFAGATPVVLVGRGHRNALVALDPSTGAVRGHVELGTAAIGPDGFDPMPARLSPVALLQTLRNDGAGELVVADPAGGRVLARWESTGEYLDATVVPWARGAVVATEHTVSVVDGDTGALEGRAIATEARVEPWQVAGDALWLRPAAPLRLGRRAPRVIDLTAPPPSPAHRDSVLADLRAPQAAGRPGGRPPCPDPGAVVHGDGLGASDRPLGPVARTVLPAWDLEVLRETARMYACAPGDAATRLLAWYVMEDDRPLRNDNALLLVEDAGASPSRYTLVQVYRHAVNREWNIAVSFHDPAEPIRTFDHRPTHAEVDAFLAQSGWNWVDDWGRILAGNVVDQEWRAATGESPWRSFPAGIEQPR